MSHRHRGVEIGSRILCKKKDKDKKDKDNLACHTDTGKYELGEEYSAKMNTMKKTKTKTKTKIKTNTKTQRSRNWVKSTRQRQRQIKKKIWRVTSHIQVEIGSSVLWSHHADSNR